MNNKNFEFNIKIQGKERCLIVTAPIENDGVATNKFCPHELLTGGILFIPPINGESEAEFISDCRKQLRAMENVEGDCSLMNLHVAGLMDAVMSHIYQCGRIIFGDLLIYMDIFSLLLEADGFEEGEIRYAYPKILREIIELFPGAVLNTLDLSPFKGSHFDLMLLNVTQKLEDLYGLPQNN